MYGKILFSAFACLAVSSASGVEAPIRKKIIAHGWDFGGVSLRNVLAHTNQFDNLPIDGAGFLVSGWLPDGRKIGADIFDYMVVGDVNRVLARLRRFL